MLLSPVINSFSEPLMMPRLETPETREAVPLPLARAQPTAPPRITDHACQRYGLHKKPPCSPPASHAPRRTPERSAAVARSLGAEMKSLAPGAATGLQSVEAT